jgi:hypothetical protein
MDTNKKNICTACGTQYSSDHNTFGLCQICDDDRQFIPESGQTWTTFNELADNYSVIAKKLNDNLCELRMTPAFAIGQRALLVITPGGNILWDCFALLNEPTIEFIKSKGGLKAIAFSHPHYYSTMNHWAETFSCPIYIHKNDEQWVFNNGSHVNLWTGVEKVLWDGIIIVNTGGHFPGSCILHVPFLSPKGAILCGDTFAIAPSKRHISAMYSYPNRIPLPLREMQRLKAQMEPIPFDTMYGYAAGQNIHLTARELLESSLAKYT